MLSRSRCSCCPPARTASPRPVRRPRPRLRVRRAFERADPDRVDADADPAADAVEAVADAEGHRRPGERRAAGRPDPVRDRQAGPDRGRQGGHHDGQVPRYRDRRDARQARADLHGHVRREAVQRHVDGRREAVQGVVQVHLGVGRDREGEGGRRGAADRDGRRQGDLHDG